MSFLFTFIWKAVSLLCFLDPWYTWSLSVAHQLKIIGLRLLTNVCYLQGFYCTQMTEGYMKCEIQEVHNSERAATAESLHGLDLIRSNSTVFPAQQSYQNMYKSPVLYPPLWPCAEKLPSIVENPSYNMFFLEPVNVAQISELTLEMEDNYVSAPICVQKNVVVKDSSGYKPQ